MHHSHSRHDVRARRLLIATGDYSEGPSRFAELLLVAIVIVAIVAISFLLSR